MHYFLILSISPTPVRFLSATFQRKTGSPGFIIWFNFYQLFYFLNIYFKCIERNIYGSIHLNLSLLHNIGSYQCFFEHANPLLADNDSPETSSGNFLETYLFILHIIHSFIRAALQSSKSRSLRACGYLNWALMLLGLEERVWTSFSCFSLRILSASR